LLKKPEPVEDDRKLEEQRRMHTELIQQTNASSRALREELDSKLNRIRDSLGTALNENKDSVTMILSENKDSQHKALTAFSRATGENLNKIMIDVNEQLRISNESQNAKLTNLSERTGKSMIEIRNKLDERLDKIQTEMKSSLVTLRESNEKKLDEMRQTVDEKLEKTLETRLQKSFETVSTQLESVNKGLGEMRSVAESVGSLNKVLSNTKTRGIMGEIQLGQIIEDMLPPHLYDTEVPTFKGSKDRVEYAVKLPGAEERQHVYLPIDSKFPLEDYYRLEEGYEKSDTEAIDRSRKALFARLRSFAGDIKNKYISPPETTNFAIMFLPTEGLYSETVRNPIFCEELRKEGIMVAGPTTLSALLNSLQVGFKTLQIQKGAAQIEKTLGAVKKEFEIFGGILEKTQDRITQAGSELEKLVGVRTRAINRKLSGVQVYIGEDSQLLIESD
jgi:DNA recombination protein RmuC